MEEQSRRRTKLGKRPVIVMAICAAVLGGYAAGSGLVSATPGSGLTMEPLARGKVDEAFKVKVKHLVQIKTKRPVDFFNMRLRLTPGGHTGWHSHPGPVLVSVRSGSVISYDDDCSSRTYNAGQGFVDPGNHVHIMRNPGSTPAELYVTAILPAGVPLRTDEPAPANCF